MWFDGTSAPLGSVQSRSKCIRILISVQWRAQTHSPYFQFVRFVMCRYHHHPIQWNVSAGVGFLCGKYLPRVRSLVPTPLFMRIAWSRRSTVVNYLAYNEGERQSTGIGHAIRVASTCATYFIRILCAHPTIITHARLDLRRHEVLLLLCPSPTHRSIATKIFILFLIVHSFSNTFVECRKCGCRNL